MYLSCCTWSLPGPENELLNDIADAGFKWIDVRPESLTSEAGRTVVRDLDLDVSCMAVSFGMPDGVSLDSADGGSASQALAYIESALAHAASLGASSAYVVLGKDGSPDALARYARSLTSAAEKASTLGMKLAIEHFPGTALPTASGTLDFLKDVDHPNLYLLFDIGHIQMSGEDPADTIISAGGRLGYVHLDDNDGHNDQHLALTDGILTEDTLSRTFSALEEVGYSGAVSLELNSGLPHPLEALKRSREIVGRWLG